MTIDPDEIGRRLAAARAAHGSGEGYARAFASVCDKLQEAASLAAASAYAEEMQRHTAALHDAIARLREEAAALRGST